MAMKTRVINVSDIEFHDPKDVVFIGRPSKFGNPFKIGTDGDREDVISKFESYFTEKLQTDPEFVKAVLALKGKVLACYCKPEACHGDVIATWVDDHDQMFDESLVAWEKHESLKELKDKVVWEKEVSGGNQPAEKAQ